MSDTTNSVSQDAYILANRIVKIKTRMLTEHPFFGLLAQHVKLSIDSEVKTACTDGERIYFGNEFSKGIGDQELYFVFFHELMHIVYKHCFRSTNLNNQLYNIAADIVINSVILDELKLDDILIYDSPLMHRTPDGEEGRLFTAEEVYEMLSDNADYEEYFFDDHSKWGTNESNELNDASWQQRIYDAVNTLEGTKGFDSVPALAKRLCEEIKNPPIDWRAILNNFIQTDICDYSFSPPDRRFGDYDFFLPDFNETEDRIEKVWIAVDSSGSISNKQLSLALNEIKGAIDQYNGRFAGWISFFDYHVTKPQAFENIEDIKQLELKGGGGTSFENVFKARRDYFDDDISCIIIITDGYAPWPKESEADGIPVLWLFNNLKVIPPWGMVARMNIKERN